MNAIVTNEMGSLSQPAANNRQAPVVLHDLRKSYGKKEVLRGASLAVPAGSVLGLLGANGSGKTTLIKCLLGLIRPQAGATHVLGEPSWMLSASAKARIGYVPQVITLYPWMKVHHLLEYTAAFYENWNDELVTRLVQDWDLPGNDRVGKLSVGQTQRLAIVLALGHEPEVLILDEPAASLDPAARRQFLQLIIDLCGPTASPAARIGPRTVLFSTHITSDLERVADRVAILKDGRITYSGLIDDLKDQVKRLHIAAPARLPDRLGIAGTLHERVTGSEAVLSVQGVTDELIGEIENRWQARVDVQGLNLEDIFLELHDAK